MENYVDKYLVYVTSLDINFERKESMLYLFERRPCFDDFNEFQRV